MEKSALTPGPCQGRNFYGHPAERPCRFVADAPMTIPPGCRAAMTQMTMGGAGANEESGVLSEASCSRYATPHYKKRD